MNFSFFFLSRSELNWNFDFGDYQIEMCRMIETGSKRLLKSRGVLWESCFGES